MDELAIRYVVALDSEQLAAEEIARLNSMVIRNSDSTHRLGLCARGTAIAITNRANGRTVVRHAAGGGSQVGIRRDVMALDYYGRVVLGIAADPKQCHDIVVRRASALQVYRYYLTHGHFLYRMSARIELFAVCSSLLSLGLAIWSVILAM